MQTFPKKFMPFAFIYAKIFKWQICSVFILLLLSAGLTNLSIRFFAEITGAIKINDAQSYNEALKYVWLLTIFGTLGIIVSQYQRYYYDAKFIIPCQTRMEKDLFSYLLGHSYEYITTKQSGMLIRQKEQVKQLPAMLDRINWDLRLFFDIMVKIIMLLCISPLIGLGYLICCIVVVFPRRRSAKRLSRISKASAKMSAIVDGRILDVINNLLVVKQFDNIEEEKKRLHPLLAQEFALNKKNMFIWWGQYNFIGAITSLMSFSLLLLSVYLWSNGAITTADIVFILMTLIYGLNGLSELQDCLQRIRQDIATVEQGLEPFCIPHGIVDAPHAKPLKVKGGAIDFQNICFKYKNAKKHVFKNFNLHIKSGEKIGIVGASGCGKSTLVHLLQRSYELDDGNILIDNQNITQVTQESLHDNISLIPQDTVMFNRSIADNIAFGTDTKSDKKIKAAAVKAYAHDFISDKDDGYNSFAGDRGCLLSGGERQRIAIARAILKNAPILILDEATSALDSESEQIIQKAIDNLIQKQTVIAIAHRLSTLKNMDRIIVLNKGKIVEEGTFNDLLKQGGQFAKLYAAQQKKGGKNV